MITAPITVLFRDGSSANATLVGQDAGTSLKAAMVALEHVERGSHVGRLFHQAQHGDLRCFEHDGKLVGHDRERHEVARGDRDKPASSRS